jgi:hypothetical protein
MLSIWQGFVYQRLVNAYAPKSPRRSMIAAGIREISGFRRRERFKMHSQVKPLFHHYSRDFKP